MISFVHGFVLQQLPGFIVWLESLRALASRPI